MKNKFNIKKNCFWQQLFNFKNLIEFGFCCLVLNLYYLLNFLSFFFNHLK